MFPATDQECFPGDSFPISNVEVLLRVAVPRFRAANLIHYSRGEAKATRSLIRPFVWASFTLYAKCNY